MSVLFRHHRIVSGSTASELKPEELYTRRTLRIVPKTVLVWVIAERLGKKPTGYVNSSTGIK